MHSIECDNQPQYPFYQCGRLLGEELKYTSIPFDLSEVKRVAVSTDGFDTNLFSEAFGAATPNALKRFLNVQKNKGHFQDDATIVTAQWVDG
jgi:hypothetical protein